MEYGIDKQHSGRSRIRMNVGALSLVLVIAAVASCMTFPSFVGMIETTDSVGCSSIPASHAAVVMFSRFGKLHPVARRVR